MKLSSICAALVLANAAQAQNPPADVRGIYVYTNDISQINTGTANQLTASFNVAGVDGAAVVIGWNAIKRGWPIRFARWGRRKKAVLPS
jgi:hypothetical protein